MAAFVDIAARTDAILKKYEHYLDEDDPNRRKPKRAKSQDPFADKYFEIMDAAQELNLKAESIAGEKNRALKATLNAELRKERQLLKEELGDLEKLARVGGADVQREKRERFEEAKRAVENVPDSTSAMAKPQWTAGSDHESGKSSRSIELKGSLSRMQTYEETAASSQFAKEARQARQRQDVALEHIEQGVTTLKELGQAMGEEVERHDRMIDDVGAKMDRVAKELQTNNMKLKGLVTKIRSTRRFFIDIILICVLLALGLYIYNTVKG